MRPRSLALRACVLAALLAVLATTAAVQADATTPQHGSVHKTMYWGAWIGSQLTGKEAPWDPRALTAW